MDASLLGETTFRHLIQTHWERWQKHRKYYPNTGMWWERYAKRMIWQLFTREGTERRRDRMTLENFYYDAIYNVHHATNYVALKQLKAKIAHLHHLEQQQIFLDNDEHDMLQGEEPSL
jgi:DNA-binding PadR family transcriptional regulator